MPEYLRPVEVERRPWQRRIEVFSPKLGRRVTLFSHAAHSAWLLLEADPHVKRFCERPALVEGNAQRTIDFWVDYGRREVFWMLDSSTGEREVLPATMHGVRVEVIRREDLVAQAAARNVASLPRVHRRSDGLISSVAQRRAAATGKVRRMATRDTPICMSRVFIGVRRHRWPKGTKAPAGV